MAKQPKQFPLIEGDYSRTREANYIGRENPDQMTAAKCAVYVGRVPVEVIIDSGAATSIITKAMLDVLGYPITAP